MNSREAAFLALLISLREEGFISEYLTAWQKKEEPSSRDFNLAQEIAFGTSRMALALDYIAQTLSKKGKLSLKLTERALMRTAIYQHCFMTRIPLYAIVNETIDIAKKYCHAFFVKYLHALLRRLENERPSLPSGKSVHDWSIRYSYPSYFIEELIRDYGLKQTEAILEAGNNPPILMARHRGEDCLAIDILKDRHVAEFACSSDYYIQNITPVQLISELIQDTPAPKHILDLCASPGGKLLAVHDCFPDAQLHANDISEEKLAKLKENLSKYKVKATISCSLGEKFVADPFDLIILDVPCSNSGVLNKRPEARWRLTASLLNKQIHTQMNLLKNATALLKPQGIIWYMTCSILKSENEQLIEKACEQYNLKLIKRKALFPNKEGWDGGFACALKKNIP